MSGRDLNKDRRYVPKGKGQSGDIVIPKKKDILDELGEALQERITELSESVSEAIRYVLDSRAQGDVTQRKV